MILGYELPVDIPVMSIYNQQAIRDYVGAVQKDYEDTNEAFDKFQEKYGDFISPIEGASEDYYNTGVGAVMNAYDDYVRRGVDPIRSVEGRAALRRAIRGVDRAKLAKMRESADNYRKYIDDVQKKKDTGKYNPYQEGVALVLAGYGPKDKSLEDMTELELVNLGTNPTAYFNNNDLWARTGADPYKTIADYWDPIFKDVPGRTTTATITGEDGRTVQVFGTKRGEDINKPIVQLHADSFYGTGAGAYSHLKTMLDRLRLTNPNATMDDAKKALEDEITKQYIKEDFNLDPAYTSRFDRTGRSGGGGGGGRRGSRIDNYDNDISYDEIVSTETNLLGNALAHIGGENVFESKEDYDSYFDSLAKDLLKKNKYTPEHKDYTKKYKEYVKTFKTNANIKMLDAELYNVTGGKLSKFRRPEDILAYGTQVLEGMAYEGNEYAAELMFPSKGLDDTLLIDPNNRHIAGKLLDTSDVLYRIGGSAAENACKLAKKKYVKTKGFGLFNGNVITYYNVLRNRFEKAAQVVFDMGNGKTRSQWYPLVLDPTRPDRGDYDKMVANNLKQSTKQVSTPLLTYDIPNNKKKK